MPFQSEKQRRFLWAVHPDIAKRWAHEYPGQKNLPTYAHEKKKTAEKPESDSAKEAHMASNVTNSAQVNNYTVGQYIAELTAKYANSAAVPVKIPHTEKPVAAGEEHVSLKGPDQEGQLLGQVSDNKAVNATNPVLHKLAVVLAQRIQQQIADEQAAAQGQQAQPVPQNVNLPQYAQPAAATPLPMGMAQAQAQQMQQAMPGAAPQAAPQQAPAAPQKTANVSPMPAGPQATAPSAPPVGSKGIQPIKPLAPKKLGPSTHPIQTFGGLSTNGDWGNPNAGLGVQNSPEKSAAADKSCSCGCGDTVKTCKCPPNCKCRQPGGSCYTGEKKAETKEAARGDMLKLLMRKMQVASDIKPFITSWDNDALLKNTKLLDLHSPRATPMQALRGIQIWAGQRGQKVPARGTIGAKHVADALRTTKNLPVVGIKPPSLAEYTAQGPQVFDNYTQLFDKLRRVPVNDVKTAASSPAWQRSEGKNDEGGLNAKGRASYNKATGGHLKAPVTEKHPTGKAKKRRHSFCSRMCGMKRVNTGAGTAKDPDSRINKSLRKWNCKCSAALQFGFELGTGKAAAAPVAPVAPAAPVSTTSPFQSFSPYHAAKDTATAAGLSTIGTTAGLGAMALLSHKARMPFLGQLFSNAAKESLLFFNPVRSYRLLKRLPQAARISAEQMRLSNKAFNSPLDKKTVQGTMQNTARRQAAMSDLRAAQKVQQDTNKYMAAHGEAPTETLEKGIGVTNGVMNLGVGGAVGLAPHLTGAATPPTAAGL